MRIAALCLVVTTALSTPIVAHQSKLDFTLLNNTGVVISELYVSPDETDDWEEDVLGRDVLNHKESIDITFGRSEKSCDWDLMIKDEKGNEIEWDSLDLCAASHITLNYAGGKATAVIK